MDNKTYLAILASGSLFAIGLAGCDAGDPGDPATPEPESSAMYEDTEDATETMADRTSEAGDELQQSGQQAEQELDQRTQQAQDRMANAGDSAMDSLDTLGTDEIVGKSVVSQQGEEIGTIDEVVMDTNSQQQLAVIDVGGFLGIGEKSVAISFDQLELSDDGRVQSDLTRETLQSQPEYDPAQYGEAAEQME
ncbi:MAG TPA: PRC-barrel domain-containing protein [Woeseiaceae bacterium]|nr:PRC-barrel domain-containing protein [Woeseiaceae bacterium]